MLAYGQKDKKLTAFMNPAGRHTIFCTSPKGHSLGALQVLQTADRKVRAHRTASCSGWATA